MVKLQDLFNLMETTQDFWLVINGEPNYYASKWDFEARVTKLAETEFNVVVSKMPDGAFKIECYDE